MGCIGVEKSSGDEAAVFWWGVRGGAARAK